MVVLPFSALGPSYANQDVLVSYHHEMVLVGDVMVRINGDRVCVTCGWVYSPNNPTPEPKCARKLVFACSGYTGRLESCKE